MSEARAPLSRCLRPTPLLLLALASLPPPLTHSLAQHRRPKEQLQQTNAADGEHWPS